MASKPFLAEAACRRLLIRLPRRFALSWLRGPPISNSLGLLKHANRHRSPTTSSPTADHPIISNPATSSRIIASRTTSSQRPARSPAAVPPPTLGLQARSKTERQTRTVSPGLTRHATSLRLSNQWAKRPRRAPHRALKSSVQNKPIPAGIATRNGHNDDYRTLVVGLPW